MKATEFLAEDEPTRIKLGGANEAAKAWIEKVYARFPQTWQNNHVMPMGDEQFAMFELVPSFSKRGAVEVKWFQAYPLRQGIGSRAMKELQAMAREDGIALTLFPWDKGQVSQSKLTKFYKGQGFAPVHKGSKNMHWAPEVSEAESGTPNAREIARQLKSAGYKQLGSGVDATVWAKDTSHVIKILMPDDANSHAEQVFQKFYEFSQSHQDIDCVPKFHMVNKIDIGDREYTQIEMEHLYPIRKNSLEEALVWILSDYAVSGEPWRQVAGELADPATWETYSGRIGPKLAELVTVNFKNPKILSMYSMLYAVMKLLYQSGHINKFGWDLHTENVMQRNNGQLVIIDPWFHINEKTL